MLNGLTADWSTRRERKRAFTQPARKGRASPKMEENMLMGVRCYAFYRATKKTIEINKINKEANPISCIFACLWSMFR